MANRKLRLNGTATAGSSMEVKVDGVVCFNGIINEVNVQNEFLEIVTITTTDCRVAQQKNIEIVVTSGSIDIGNVEANLVPGIYNGIPSLGEDLYTSIDSDDSRTMQTIDGVDVSTALGLVGDIRGVLFTINEGQTYRATISLHKLELPQENKTIVDENDNTVNVVAYPYAEYAANYIS